MKLINDDVLNGLKQIPDESVNCVITSPPYWQLRDYGFDGQWGLEPTFQEYLDNLWCLMDEIYRVLTDDGTVWINLGDTYSGSNGFGWKQSVANINQSNGSLKNVNYRKLTNRDDGNIKDKCLLMIPQRFAIGCIERGWIVRNEIIWAKNNSMPESVTDRFSKKNEKIYFMTKSKKYHFDLDSVREQHKDISLKRAERKWEGHREPLSSFANKDIKKSCHPLGKNPGDVWVKEKPQYSVIDKKYRNLVINYRNLPNKNEISNYLNTARKLKGITINELEQIIGGSKAHHWFEKGDSFAYPTVKDWKILKELLNLDDKYDDCMLTEYEKSGLKQNNEEGANPGDVWFLNTKGSSEKHYAMFNDNLIKRPILAGCPVGGVVLDCFMGTGTTGVTALRYGRDFIGIEGKKEYFDTAKKNIEIEQSKIKLFA